MALPRVAMIQVLLDIISTRSLESAVGYILRSPTARDLNFGRNDWLALFYAIGIRTADQIAHIIEESHVIDLQGREFLRSFTDEDLGNLGGQNVHSTPNTDAGDS
ncbi:hypothetical protein HGA91_06120 [candidate division WWE3 bacterium]|nr:hypothetical protein [candidate division WWE3 bacterium]